MAFQISEVTSESEYQEIVSAELTSFESPPSAYRTLFYPKTDTNPEARVKAIEGGTARVIQSQRSKPYQRWVKAVDPESGKVVGAAEWRFFESDPYTGVSLPKANWWPEGEEKEFTTSYWHELIKPRIKYGSRRHAYLVLCFVLPGFRRRGAATQLVKWGVEKADELDMTSLLDAAPVEKVLYERLGFVVQEEFVMNFSKENPGAVWEKLEKECLPHVTLLMIRSKEGVQESE